MARSHGRIYTVIWIDPDFLALTPTAQRLYLFLLTQPDLNQAGLVALRTRRWSRAAQGLTVDSLAADLAELEVARFVLVDEDTEEVLLRTFVRNDGVHRQPNVMRRMGEDAVEIASPQLRQGLLDELLALDLSELSDEPTARGGLSVRAVARTVIEGFREGFAKGSGEGLPEGFTERSPRPPTRDRPPAAPSPIPQSPVPPTAAAQPAALIDVPASPLSVNRRAQALARIYVELVPLSKFPAVMRICKQAIDVGYDDVSIEQALRRLVVDGRPVTVDTLRLELEGPPQRASTTDQRVRAALDLRDRLHAQETAAIGGAR